MVWINLLRKALTPGLFLYLLLATSPLPAQTLAPPADDYDGDGISSAVEVMLGTHPERKDTDGDGLNDKYEVDHGLNPFSIDSNRDGIDDLIEEMTRGRDIDGDGIPNAWDYDNDGDGVPDEVDLSPFSRTNPLRSFHFSILGNNRPLYLNLQIRPKNPADVNLIFKYLDWPDGDDLGQIKDLDNSKNDLLIIPMLELSKIKGEFPRDSLLCREYGLIVRGSKAYLPLTPVVHHGKKVAWQARLFLPKPGPKWIGEIRLIWVIKGKTDYIGPDGSLHTKDQICALYRNTRNRFILTGWTVEEDYSISTAILYNLKDFHQIIKSYVALETDVLLDDSPLPQIKKKVKDYGFSVEVELGTFSNSDQALTDLQARKLRPLLKRAKIKGVKGFPAIIILRTSSIASSMDEEQTTKGQEAVVSGDKFNVNLLSKEELTVKSLNLDWFDPQKGGFLNLEGIARYADSLSTNEKEKDKVLALLLSWKAGERYIVASGNKPIYYHKPERAPFLTTLKKPVKGYLPELLKNYTPKFASLIKTNPVGTRVTEEALRDIYLRYQGLSLLTAYQSYLKRSAKGRPWPVPLIELKRPSQMVKIAGLLANKGIAWYGGIEQITASGCSDEDIAAPWGKGVHDQAGFLIDYGFPERIGVDAEAVSKPIRKWITTSGWTDDLTATIMSYVATSDILTRPSYGSIFSNKWELGNNTGNQGILVGNHFDVTTRSQFYITKAHKDADDTDLENTNLYLVYYTDSPENEIQGRWVPPDVQVRYSLNPRGPEDNKLIAKVQTETSNLRLTLNKAKPNARVDLAMQINYAIRYQQPTETVMGTQLMKVTKTGYERTQPRALWIDILPRDMEGFLKWDALEDWDKDNDGMDNYAEQLLGTDPDNPDSDGDGIGDRYETKTPGLSPIRPDSDDDGLPDGLELYLGTSPIRADTDGDQLADGSEWKSTRQLIFQAVSQTYYLPFYSSPFYSDTDGDGLSDNTEFQKGTNPRSIDSNDDGISDNGENLSYTIKGQIKDKKTGRPLENVSVRLESMYYHKIRDRVTRTDADGFYKFDDIPFDRYKIIPHLKDSYFQIDHPSDPRVCSIIVAHYDGLTRDFLREKGKFFLLGGLIRFPDSRGVEGIKVQAIGDDGVKKETVTDSSGHFLFRLRKGDYLIKPVSSGYKYDPPKQKLRVWMDNEYAVYIEAAKK